jgi:hypothetical protein
MLVTVTVAVLHLAKGVLMRVTRLKETLIFVHFLECEQYFYGNRRRWNDTGRVLKSRPGVNVIKLFTAMIYGFSQ